MGRRKYSTTALRGNGRPRPSPPPESYSRGMRLLWPLTGRSTEMRLIANAISDPDVSGIVISGAAGVGKSRVAREALAAVPSEAYDVRWVVGTTSGRVVPLGALAAWVGSGSRDDSLKLVRKVIDSLILDAAGRQIIVAVDDVPLLDELSTFVIAQVIQRRAATVVLTVRETVRDDESLIAATRELWAQGRFERLDLQP